MLPLEGPRVRLRPCREDDAAGFAAINADPLVMRHFRAPLSRAESDAMLARVMACQAAEGMSFWAIERQGDLTLLGMCGLSPVRFAAAFAPAVEIGWRLSPAHWGLGLASDAARLALGAGFGPLGLPEIIAFTVPANRPSWRLMQRLGMVPAGGFDHPNLPERHALRPHVLYRLTREAWFSRLG